MKDSFNPRLNAMPYMYCIRKTKDSYTFARKRHSSVRDTLMRETCKQTTVETSKHKRVETQPTL